MGVMELSERQDSGSYSSGYGPDPAETPQEQEQVNFWWTPAGLATRYAIGAAILILLLLYFVGGYYHARSRMAKGKPPLAYHRWMVRRGYFSSATPYAPPSQYAYASGANGPGYQMESFPAPPPAYNNAEFLPPPSYQPPQGGSKALADQNFPGGVTHRVGESSTQPGGGRF